VRRRGMTHNCALGVPSFPAYWSLFCLLLKISQGNPYEISWAFQRNY
jgi:hypothetical protein